MKSEHTFIVHPESVEQENALKAFVKALKIKFEVRKSGSYDPEFVSKIEESKRQVAEGKTQYVDKKDLKDFLGL